jgi:hypothetical protein
MSLRDRRLFLKIRAGFLLGSLLAVSSFALAQRATLLGTVIDADGAVVPEVKITLLNLDQGLKREAITSGEGYYTLALLQPGRYLVAAQKEGFAIAEIKDVILHLEDVRTLNIKLQVGASLVRIQVTDQSQNAETASPTLAQIVTGDVVRNAPLNGRSVPDLAYLQPGVTPINPDVFGLGAGGFNVNGNRSDSVTYFLDGGLNNDLVDNRAAYTPNPDTIAEFQILTSNYPAEYGRNAGGIVTMLTRSGTNQLHGSAFDFLRNDALDANSFFNKNSGLPRDVLKRNQFGGTLGGPITIPGHIEGKDRFFFFVGYQGEYQVQALSEHNIPVFTPAELGGDFSQAGPGGTPNAGVANFLKAYPFFQQDPGQAARAVIDPRRINSVARDYIAAGLMPTSPSGLLNWQGRLTVAYDELTGRLDFNISDKDKLAVTLGWNREHDMSPLNIYGANVPGFPESYYNHDYFANLSHIHIFSSTLLNELRGTVERSSHQSLNPTVQLPGPAALGIGITPDLSIGPASLLFDTGLQIGFSTDGPQRFTDNTYSIADTLTWINGRHNLKFGGGVSAFQSDFFFAFNVVGQFAFVGSGGLFTQNSYADFLLGLPLQYTQSSAAPSNFRSKFSFGFAQDEWRLRKDFVLSAGLRYEYATPKLDTDGRTFSIIPGQQSRVFIHAPVGMVFPGDPGAPRGVNFPDRDNFAPRIGFAWSPGRDGKTSLRGAFGVFYDILKGEDNLQFNGKPPFFAAAGFPYAPLSGNPASESNYMSQPFIAAGVENPFPSESRPPSNLNFAAAGYLPIGASNSVFVVDPHLRTPYTYQYHLTLERELAKRTILQASYTGSSSHGLTALIDMNPVVLGTFNRVLNLTPGNSTCSSTSTSVCSFANIEEFRNLTIANYNGLQLSLQKQISGDGFFGSSYFTLAYTYAHNIDNASGLRNRNSNVPSYDPGLFRASADMDLRHRVELSGGWELPFERAWKTAPAKLTKGWKVFPIVGWRTGYPLDVSANLPSAFDYASPGPSGAGDAGLVHANLVRPVKLLDPHAWQAIEGASGYFWFDPGSFSYAQCPPAPTTCQPSSTMFPNDSQAVSDPAVRTYGTLPRNYFRGPGVFNINLAFSKTTSLTDRLNMETRADFFNLLNHTEYLTPNTNISSPTFGQLLNTYDPRIIQLALRLTF